MTFSFDLISDLHLETWDGEFDWTDQATSTYCVVVGDVSRDREKLIEVLTHLGQHYHGVFYIDGNDEHRYGLDNLEASYEMLETQITNIKNVVWLHGNCVVINGVAFLGTNGWWTYNFDNTMDTEQCIQWNADRYHIDRSTSSAVREIALSDAAYLMNSIRRLQTQPDVKAIVLATHTVPAPWIIDHDVDLVGTWRFNCMGNRYLTHCLDEDTMGKVKTWCFGHYHRPVDTVHQGVRYVSNCRGRGDTDWKQTAYNPKRITITV